MLPLVLFAPSCALKPSEDIVSRSVDSPPAPSISVSKAVDISASLAVASCNVTSLRKKFALLDFADIVGIQESRHTATGLSALASKLRTIGYSVIFGHPLSAQVTKKKKVSRTLFNGQQGGVALAFKHHISAQTLLSDARKGAFACGNPNGGSMFWYHMVLVVVLFI